VQSSFAFPEYVVATDAIYSAMRIGGPYDGMISALKKRVTTVMDWAFLTGRTWPSTCRFSRVGLAPPL
jgi:hypothetical protein